MEAKQKFTVRITKDPTGGYSGRCLEIPAAISEGETLEELTANMKEVIQLVLEHMKEKAKKEKSQIIEITI